MSKQDLKYKLDPQAYEKLREVIKKNTSFENLTKENIETRKEAITILKTWLEEVYTLDQKTFELDEDGVDIEKLFKDA